MTFNSRIRHDNIWILYRCGFWGVNLIHKIINVQMMEDEFLQKGSPIVGWWIEIVIISNSMKHLIMNAYLDI